MGSSICDEDKVKKHSFPEYLERDMFSLPSLDKQESPG
jgi:hypothetical protein